LYVASYLTGRLCACAVQLQTASSTISHIMPIVPFSAKDEVVCAIY